MDGGGEWRVHAKAQRTMWDKGLDHEGAPRARGEENMGSRIQLAADLVLPRRSRMLPGLGETAALDIL